MKKEDFSFPLHVIVHPFDGFWDMKYEQRGKLRMVALILILVIGALIFQKQYAGFLVNRIDPRTLNSLDDVIQILFAFFLWSISNWAVCTLMDGEGRFKDIMMATAYSLVPLILIYYPTTFISNFLTQEEAAFYYLLNTMALIWCAGLLIAGTMTVHQFTMGKTLVTMLLTLIMAAIVIFLMLLLYSLFQQMIDFVYSIYTELIFRK
ncbi:Yip1 family protein [Paenibacillus bouchesdurhonensis]|uniref:Yip1 family protein n=1 Tax=Paenibacillus bouchesdurhonensis TaxID=1870990 RepID=UPI000DA60BE0|nr:Yip1 family protein [Paenibacillus bouchesdurhonensis]